MLKAQQKVTCSKCNHPIDVMARYCCDPLKSFCFLCANQKCRVCLKQRTNLKNVNNQFHSVERLQKRKYCCNCKQTEETLGCEFYFEQKCKQYSCHSCLLIFYYKYCTMIDRFQSQFGSELEMLVQLKCGCEVQRSKIAEYVKRYCYDCSKKLQGPIINLKDQCRIMRSCFDNLHRIYKSSKTSLSRRQDAKKILADIYSMMMRCDTCSEIIDGERLKVGEKIDNLYVCNLCLEAVKETQMLYEKKSQERHILEKKENSKQEIQKKPNIQKVALSCSECSQIIVNPINQNSICKQCYDRLDHGENIEILQERSKDSKIKDLLKHQIIKASPKKEQAEIEKNESREQKSKLIILNRNLQSHVKKQSNIQVINKDSKGQQAKKNFRQMNEKMNKLSIQEQVELPQLDSESGCQFKSIDQFSQINEQFLKVKTQKLNFNAAKVIKYEQCYQCKCHVAEQNCFKVYQKQATESKILRIAQNEEELVKFNKENLIKNFCKICYFSLKRKIKREEFLKREESLRREQANRYGRSAPKPQKDLNFSIPSSKKDQMNNTLFKSKYLYLSNGDDFVKSPIKRVEKQKQSEKQQCIKRYCFDCKKYFSQHDYNLVQRICKGCQISKIQKELKQKKVDDFKKQKCAKCKKIYTISVKQTSKYKLCTQCSMFLFTK